MMAAPWRLSAGTRAATIARLPFEDFETTQRSARTRMLGCNLIDGAGHWVQQERPQRVTRLLLESLEQLDRDPVHTQGNAI